MAILLGFLSVFPAYAGVILKVLDEQSQKDSLSRIRGGDPAKDAKHTKDYASFPHTRG